MITLLTGENSYEIEQALRALVVAFAGDPEKFDGLELELGQLPDLLSGMSLFAEKRLVIIRGLAGNKPVWEVLPTFLERISDDIHLVLVEPVLDKRTKTYKALQKVADVKELQPLTERDSAKAEHWLIDEAKAMGVKLDSSSARLLIHRSLVPSERGQPVIDQWRAFHSLEKVAVLGDITSAVIETYIDTEPIESVFSVFETALKGDTVRLHQLLSDLEPREDPFKVFGLLSGQVFQLTVLAASDKPSSEVASAIGVHPYALSKLVPMAKKLTGAEVKQIAQAFTKADEAMKTSKGTPWVLTEQALMKVAAVTAK